MPSAVAVQQQVSSALGTDGLDTAITAIANSWPILLASVGITIVLGLLFMLLMRLCSGLIIWLLILLSIGTLIGLGVILINNQDSNILFQYNNHII
jgi:hypothetical protein